MAKKETKEKVKGGAEVVEPAVEEKELVHVTGDSFDIFKASASTFVPQLTEDMSEQDRKDAVRQILRQTQGVEDRLKLVQGELLYEVKNNEYFKDWKKTVDGDEMPFDSFEDYAENELNIKRRQAFYLIDIYETFVVKLALPKEVLNDMEWSKAKELTKIIDKDNADEVLNEVKSMSVRETIEFAREKKAAKGLPGGMTKDEEFETLSFRLTTEQKQSVEDALKLAGEMSRSEKKPQQLEYICVDFLAGSTAGGTAGALDSLQTHIGNLERAFGVKIEVTSTTDDRYSEEGSEAKEEEAVA